MTTMTMGFTDLAPGSSPRHARTTAPSTGFTSAFAFHPIHAPHRAHGAADAKRRAMSGGCPRRMVKRPRTRAAFVDDDGRRRRFRGEERRAACVGGRLGDGA